MQDAWRRLVRLAALEHEGGSVPHPPRPGGGGAARKARVPVREIFGEIKMSV